MQGLEYEYAVANYLSEHGYKNVSVTKGSGDYGVDVIANKGKRRYAVQCKYYSNPVGLAAVQEAVAGKAMYGCTDAMVVTNSTFTSAAKTLAEANGVMLLDNISPAGRGARSKIKVLFWCVYIFLASAIVYSTYTVVREQEIAQATYNIVLTVLVLTIPFWVKPLFKALKRLIVGCLRSVKRNLKRSHEKKEAVSALLSKHPSELPTSAPLPAPEPQRPLSLEGQAIRIVVNAEVVKPQLLQRELRIGYSHANDLLAKMEAMGIVGPQQEDGSRHVLISGKELYMSAKET